MRLTFDSLLALIVESVASMRPIDDFIPSRAALESLREMSAEDATALIDGFLPDSLYSHPTDPYPDASALRRTLRISRLVANVRRTSGNVEALRDLLAVASGYELSLFPVTPKGLRLARQVVALAKATRLDPVKFADARSPLAGLALAWKGRTTVRTRGAYDLSVEWRFPFGAGIQGTLPGPIGAESPVGRVITFQTLRRWQSEAGACDSGTAEFLRDHGIDFRRESHSQECYECGSVHEDEDSLGDGEIIESEAFTLTDEIVEAIDADGDGYLPAMLRVLDIDGPEDPREIDPREIDSIEPDADGATVPSGWRFDPDPVATLFGEDDPADGCEDFSLFAEQAAALDRLARRFREAGKIPPMDGTLRAPHSFGVEPVRWSPREATLASASVTGPRWSLDVRTRQGRLRDSDGRDANRFVLRDARLDNGAAAVHVSDQVKAGGEQSTLSAMLGLFEASIV